MACTSNLRAALCAFALAPLGLNAVLFGAAQLSEADKQLAEDEAARLQNLEVAAKVTFAAWSLDHDLLAHTLVSGAICCGNSCVPRATARACACIC